MTQTPIAQSPAAQNIDQLDRSRRRALAGFLAAFAAWQIPTIAREILGRSLPDPVAAGLTLLAAAAGVLWIVSLLRLLLLQRAVARDPEAAAALDDERVHRVRARALAFGFWALVVYLAAVRLADFVVAVPAGAAALGGLLVAAVTATTAFLILDRE